MNEESDITRRAAIATAVVGATTLATTANAQQPGHGVGNEQQTGTSRNGSKGFEERYMAELVEKAVPVTIDDVGHTPDSESYHAQRDQKDTEENRYPPNITEINQFGQILPAIDWFNVGAVRVRFYSAIVMLENDRSQDFLWETGRDADKWCRENILVNSSCRPERVDMFYPRSRPQFTTVLTGFESSELNGWVFMSTELVRLPFNVQTGVSYFYHSEDRERRRDFGWHELTWQFQGGQRKRLTCQFADKDIEHGLAWLWRW